MKELNLSTPDGRAMISNVVILVHGIRDLGGWQEELDQALIRDGIVTVGIRYGYFDLFRFLFPIPWFRNLVVQKVARRVRDAHALFPNAKFSYIAHSFGTYVVANILIDDRSLRTGRIIFCGSVLSPDFPVSQLHDSFDAPLLNEVGLRDSWPLLASSVTWGYGHAGSTGFGQPYVEDRFHSHGHGGFLTAKFAQDFWVPFLKEGKVVNGIIPSSPSLLRRFLLTAKLKYLPLALVVLLLGIWKLETNRPCTERWLSQGDYQACFDSVKSTLLPISVEGRRSWLGFGSSVFKAKWIDPTVRYCYFSSSDLTLVRFEQMSADYVGRGYDLVSEQSFEDSDGIERFQGTWVHYPAQDASCP